MCAFCPVLGGNMKGIGLYIHIPFCKKKCFYCDFTSMAGRYDLVERYIDYLIMEISLYKDRIGDCPIETIFIGGGTPSSIDDVYIKRVLDYIYDNFNTNYLKEISIEANPGTLTLEKASAYRESKIDRISLGLQTTQDEMLKDIGRIHRVDDFYRSYNILKECGFDNINVDLIFGLPNQALKDVIGDLEVVTSLEIPHISYYSLIVEPDTPMYEWHRNGRLNLPDEDTERLMYHKGIEFLKSRGYEHYEISNFAKKGYQCKHNILYWKVEPYVGVGLGSHSNIYGKRYWNTSKFDVYFKQLDEGLMPTSGEEIIHRGMEMAEYCILGLRLIDGIDIGKFKDRFGSSIYDIYGEQILKHSKNKLLREKSGKIALTRKGLDLANLVEVDFFP